MANMRRAAPAPGALFSRGTHRIRVTYYQGPGFRRGSWSWQYLRHMRLPRSSHTDDFLPPKDPATWVEGTIKNIERG